MRTILFALALLVSVFNQQAFAVSISKNQIDQFKSLPLAQQKQLAKAYGVDIDALKKLNNSNNGVDDEPKQNLNQKGFGEEFESRETSNSPQEESKNNQNLKLFGVDVFANTPSTFAPTSDIAIPDDYVVAPGDSVSIQTFGKESNQYSLPITREGDIVIPELGPFHVAGLSFVELKQFVSAKLKEKTIGINAVVTLDKLRALKVFVLGEAYKPGPYVLSSLSTITHAIFAAGGITDIGSLRNIQLKRHGKLISKLDLYDLLLKGDSSGDKLLKNGDVVFIPPSSSLVTVKGDVVRPAIYETLPQQTVAETIKNAGGLLPTAYKNELKLERYTHQQTQIITIDYTSSQQAQQKIQPGDTIIALPKAKESNNAITVKGAVVRAGEYQWREGMKITDILPRANGFLLDDADFNYSLLVRKTDLAKNIEVYQFSLQDILANPASTKNYQLQPLDQIIVFNTKKIIDDKLDTEEDASEKTTGLSNNRYNRQSANNQYDNNKIYQQTSEAKLNESMELIGDRQDQINDKNSDAYARATLLKPIIEQLKAQAVMGNSVKLVDVYGDVAYEGTYPLAKNATVKDLLFAAGGVIESAYLDRAELTRTIINNDKADIQLININLNQVLTTKDDESILKLHSKDRLNVLRIPAWSENLSVELKGEFRFPGKYTIRRGDTLSSLIKKAGGFTQFAFPQGALFTREKLKKLEQENINRVIKDLRLELAAKNISSSNDMSVESVDKVLRAIAEVKPIGRMVLDINKVMNDPNYDVALDNGDTLIVPSFKNTVSVIGQVQVASSFIYNNNLSVEDYINKTGGVKKRADNDKIYIVSANGDVMPYGGSNWFSVQESRMLKPGDTIVVPLDSEYTETLTFWSEATRILYNSAIAVAAIKSL